MKKNILITGASGNLGKATVDRFVKDGHQVIITVTPGRDAGFAIPEGVAVYEADLTNEDQTSKAVQEINNKFKTIDAALLLVGGFALGGIKDTDGTSLNKMFSLNFNTAYFVARPVLAQMSTQESGGKIIFVGARPALIAKDGKTAIAYGLSKSLLFKLAEYINTESTTSKVVASVIVPSTIDTPANRQAMPDKNFNDWVKPEEIAGTLAFLCSDAARPLREPVVKLYGNA